MRIADYLSPGQENAIPLRHLEAMTGWPGRDIRKQIAVERRTGVPILSNNRTGYYLAADEVEAEQFVRSMRGRAHEILKTASAVERAAGLD